MLYIYVPFCLGISLCQPNKLPQDVHRNDQTKHAHLSGIESEKATSLCIM
jgi:hypothetical protein